MDELAGGRTIERQVQIWLREVGLRGVRDAAERYEAAGADTAIFVLDDERDPDLLARLAASLR
ncbi:MAG: hypothetical protein ACRDG8_07405 [Actinomycetota bacterium]